MGKKISQLTAATPDSDDLIAFAGSSTLGVTVDTLRGAVSVTDYGATGDGVTDDAAAIQSAIDALSSGGTLLFPQGQYRIGAKLTVDKPLHMIGSGYGTDSTSTNGGNVGSTTLTASASIVMMEIVSSVASNYLHGGEVRGILFDGATQGTHAIHAKSCKDWIFDVAVRRVTTAAVTIDDSNGVQSAFNNIRLWFVYGSTTGVRPAHGLVIQGSTGNGGNPQNRIWVHGLIYDGDMLRLEGCDNNVVFHCSGVTQSGGTGVSLRITENGPESRNHLIYYLQGNLDADDGSFGNRVLHGISEGQEFSVASGGQMHFDVMDYTNSGVWATHRYALYDEYSIPGTTFEPDGSVATIVSLASLWRTVRFPESASGNASVQIPHIHRWNDGNINSISFVFASDGTSAGNAVFRIRAITPAALGAVSTPTVDENATLAVNASANVANRVTHTLSTAIAYTLDDILLLRLDRLPADAGDTHTDNLFLLGVTLNYTGDGPGAGGPYDVTGEGT